MHFTLNSCFLLFSFPDSAFYALLLVTFFKCFTLLSRLFFFFQQHTKKIFVKGSNIIASILLPYVLCIYNMVLIPLCSSPSLHGFNQPLPFLISVPGYYQVLYGFSLPLSQQLYSSGPTHLFLSFTSTSVPVFTLTNRLLPQSPQYQLSLSGFGFPLYCFRVDFSAAFVHHFSWLLLTVHFLISLTLILFQ